MLEDLAPGVQVGDCPGSHNGHYRTATTAAEFRSCVKGEVAAPGFPSLIVLMVSASERKATLKPKNCVKGEVAALGSPSLIVLMVSVDVKQLRT